MTTPFQPTLPAEIAPSDAEIAFIEDSPPKLFPENQDSNFGLIRRIMTDRFQDLANQQETLYNERFVDTSTEFLDVWESEVGLPVAPSGLGLQERRQAVLGRLARGPFTRARRAAVVEKAIEATYGTPFQLSPDGVPIPVDGIPLYGEIPADLHGTYNIYQDVHNFIYYVYVTSLTTPNITNLTRELDRITPGGISFTIDNTRTIPIYYPYAARDDAPQFYAEFSADGNDRAGVFALVPTLTGAPAYPGGNGLISANATGGGAVSLGGAAAFDYGDVDFFDFINTNSFSVEAWIDPAALDSANHYIVNKNAGVGSGGGWSFYIDTTNKISLQRTDNVASDTLAYTLPDANAHHVVGTYDGATMKLYLDGVMVASMPSSRNIQANTSHLRIGSSAAGAGFFNGLIDEVAIYNEALTDAQVARHHTTGIGLFA